MDLTSPPTDDELLAFFRTVLVPLSETSRERHVAFFPSGPEREATTYYVDRDDEANYLYSVDPDNIATELAARWRRDGYSDLVPLAVPLVALAKELAAEQQQTEDISPLIYTLF
jgi:hypothetical protein